MTKNVIFEICVTLVLLTVIVSAALYYINDRKMMAQNISEAIAKGVDPLAVRCSYSNNTDTVCVAHAASPKK